MTHTAIIVSEVGSTTAVDDWEITEKDATLDKVVIMEKATAGGKTGIILVFKTSTGQLVAATTTAAMLQGITSALNGAEQRFKGDKRPVPQSLEEVINALIQENEVDSNNISDGYHTFGELYDHRITNYLVLCRILRKTKARYVWRSKRHSDGEEAFGGTWFVLGINYVPGDQITYHLPIEFWNKTEFAETLYKAPDYDGHTAADVLERLSKIHY